MSVVRSAQHAIKPILTLANKHPRLLIVTAFATISTPWLYGNYRAFIDLGPGGLPYNVFGWLAALSLKLVARETKSTEEYVKDGSQERWLKDEDVKQREGDRPRFGWHVAPVRQQDMLPSAEMAKVRTSNFLFHDLS